MPRVAFTPQLEKHLPCPARSVSGATVREALEAVFADSPQLRGYVLDDQQRLRQHVAIFVNQQPLRDRLTLSDPIAADGEIFVWQALSGG